MTKLFIWNNLKKVGFLIVLATQNPAYAGSDFQYFGSEINFWNDKAASPDSSKSHSTSKATDEVAGPETGFSWQKYMSPNNKEFFKEGDYTPPEPFMEIVRNPTDENIKMWFAYIGKKNELSQRLQERMQAYMAKNTVQQGDPGQEVMKAKLAKLPVAEPNAKRFRFRMYFDSHCPHCKKMFETLSDLQARGFYVEAKQVDSNTHGLEGLTIPTSKAAAGEIKEKDIQSVPVLFIGDLEKKQVYRLSGYQSTANVFAAMTQ